MIHGGMSFNDEFSMAHFLIMAVIHVNGAGKKLTEQVIRALLCRLCDLTLGVQILAEKAILRTWTKSSGKQKWFLLAMELYIVKERRAGVARYD